MMNVSKVKAISVVFALLLFVGLFTVGCTKKPKNAWVNTASLPGQTFSKNNVTANNSGIIDLSSNGSSSGVRSDSNGFGPGDVSFEFRDLR